MRYFSHLNVRTVAEMLGDLSPFRPFAAADDRVAWLQIAERVGPIAVERLVAAAQADMQAPLVALPASLYLDFSRTGRREPYEDAQRRRRNMAYRLTIAECIEGKGRFVEALSDLLWARLEETNWSWPAHASGLDRPDHPTVDLAAAMTALDLAETDYLLGEQLDPTLRLAIRSQIDRRCTTPFLQRHDFFWLHGTPTRPVNNWTAVCIAGIVGAACYLESDPNRLATIMARGIAGLDDYLATFDTRGGSTEGPDYWSYGFGNFVVLAQLIQARSAGAIDLLASDFVAEIAQFPLRTVLDPGHWASFSDSDLVARFPPGLLTFLADRFGLPALTQMGTANDFVVDHFNQFAWPLRQYLWPLPPATERFGGTRHDWFPDMAWMIARLDPDDPDALRLAVKAGHNGEMHNQNDVGSFIVTSAGQAVLTDPGRGRYSRAYFGPERYDFLMASSLGHSVPVVNGHAQAAGAAFAATVLSHHHTDGQDSLSFDMAGAYPAEAGIAALRRTVTIDRVVPGGAVVVSDQYRFADGPGTLLGVLVTTGVAQLEPGRVIITQERACLVVQFAAGLTVTFERHENVEKQYAPSVDLTRIVFTPDRALQSGTIVFDIRPLAAEPQEIPTQITQ